MSYRKYLLILFACAVFGWSALILVLSKLEPCEKPGRLTLCESYSQLGLALIFLSGFFVVCVTAALFGFAIRFWFHRTEFYLDHLTVSIRQGLLLGALTTLCFILLLLQALTWWSGLLLVAIVLLIELYFARGT